MSRTDTEAFEVLRRTMAEVFFDAPLLPARSESSTEARHCYASSGSVHRPMPLPADRSDLARAHGVDEFAPVAAFGDAVRC